MCHAFLGSASTDMKGGFGGLDGRALKKGDRFAARIGSQGSRLLAFGLSPDVWETPVCAIASPDAATVHPCSGMGGL